MEPDSRIKSAQARNMLEAVRRISAGLPESEEIIDGFGHHTFKVNGKSYAILGEDEQGPGLSFKSDRENQEFLVQQGPYYRTPYIGRHGWVTIDNPEDWETLGELIREAYLRAAPKRLAKQLLL